MSSTDAELETQLKEVGKQLSHPPDSVDQLLPVLDEVEKLLTKVDQSPKKSMLDALKPSMTALIQDDLSKHSDNDVKVAVASCISEITRITAPDAPYTDDEMRDVFQLIVSSFKDLADQSSRSYKKRASILETVSKVRSCVIMLDLECDGLIVEMFEHFLDSVRDYHLDNIYSSMENIMVLVFEESEEISVDMLKPLLARVKKHSEGVLPVARKLGEGVLRRSAAKLRPYVLPAVISLGETVDNYSPIVASVHEGTTATFEQNDENAQTANESKSTKGSLDEAQQADDSKLTTASSDHTDKVVKEEASAEEVERSPKSVMSNGVNVIEKEEASVDQESSKKQEEDINQENPNSNNTDDSDADKLAAKSEETPKKRGKKSDPVTEPSDSSHIEGEKEAEKVPESQKNDPVKDSSTVIPEKDNDVQVSSPKAVVSSPSQSDEKKTVRSKKKPVPEQEVTDTASPSKSGEKKVGRSKNKGQEDTKPSEESDAVKSRGKKAAVSKVNESEEASSDSDAKPLKKPIKKQSGKKQKPIKKVDNLVESKGKSKKVDESDSVKKVMDSEEEEESDSDAKPLKPSSSKKGNTDAKSSSKKKDDGKKRASGKNVAEKDEAKPMDIDDEMDSSSKTATKSTKGKSNSKESSGNSSKRKRNSGKEKVSEPIKYDKSLVGLKVKVWWPEDKMYYEGQIESYESAKKKHKVSYVDGDEEILNLKTQKWEIIQEYSSRDEEPNAEAAPETPKKKKSKSDPAPSASQEKKDSAKRVSEPTSSTKSKSQKSKSTSQKSTTKEKEEEETPKTGNKSKGKSKGKSNTSESVKTPESAKGKSVEPTKGGGGSGSKSTKKRKKT